MALPFNMDRQLLGDAGLALDDSVYVQVVAELGASWRNWESASWGWQHSLAWLPANFRIGLQGLGVSPDVATLRGYQERWRARIASSVERRILIDEGQPGRATVDLGAIARILSYQAVGSRSVFVEKTAPLAEYRWQWPLRLAAFPDEFKALGLSGLSGHWPAMALVELQELTREQPRCEVLVVLGSVRDGLRRILDLPYSVRAGHIVFFGPVDIPWPLLSRRIDTLYGETRAGAVSLVSLPATVSVPVAINDFVRELSHNQPYDFALANAFPRLSSLHILDPELLDRAALPTAARQLGARLKQLSPELKFSLPEQTPGRLDSSWTADRSAPDLGLDLESRARDLPYDREADSGQGLSEVAVAERDARRESARAEPSRYLQGNLFGFSEGHVVPETSGLAVDTWYRLDVFIGLPGEGAIAADQPFPAEELDWSQQERYTLDVLFAEPRQWAEPLKGSLELPRFGRSSTCSFTFSPTQPGPFRGRVILVYRGRVLQTALLEATVVATAAERSTLKTPASLRFVIEAEIRQSFGTLDDRRHFDACMVLNQTAAGTRAGTTAGREGAYIASLDGIDPQLAAINGLLNQVALNAKRYEKGLRSKANARLLSDLAAEGNLLYRSLVIDYLNRSSAAQALRDARYLQIVSTKPDAIVPLEFVYGYPPPREDAPVCRNAARALRDGQCPEGCVPQESPAPHVCPLGFWGLSKVIERHLHDPGLPKPARVEAGLSDHGEPLPGRESLRIAGQILLATSKQVPSADRGQLKSDIAGAWNGKVTAVRKWATWRNAVKRKKPVILLALPHAEGVGRDISLEISGDILKSIYIDEGYVLGDPAQPPPLVLLFGCDTANVAYTEAYSRHVAVFRQAKAALVLGTIATVFGPDAAKVAAKLVIRLANTANQTTGRFGEVLLQAKREAIAESLMMALCLVAFGDADWQLIQGG